MKIRTDFVTNSSSSSFVLEIGFKLVDGRYVSFSGHGGTGEAGREDYFDGDAIVTVSPKTLALATDVETMIQILTDGVIDEGCHLYDSDDKDKTLFTKLGKKIFKKSESIVNDFGKKYNAFNFIKKIKKEIQSMDDIESVTITGNEYNYINYLRTYTYNRITGEYIGTVSGEDFEKDGSSGGNLCFDDGDCTVNGVDKIAETLNLFPIIRDIEGTAYVGRKERIEFVHVGDELILQADYNSPYYEPVSIEVFNTKQESLGFLRDSYDMPLKRIATVLDKVDACVATVTPISQRGKNAKYALMDVEIRLRGTTSNIQKTETETHNLSDTTQDVVTIISEQTSRSEKKSKKTWMEKEENFRILALLEKHSWLSNAEIARKTKLSSQESRACLEQLIKSGLVLKTKPIYKNAYDYCLSKSKAAQTIYHEGLYQYAIYLMEVDKDYESAQAKFAKLKNYKESQAKKKECVRVINAEKNKKQYAKACALAEENSKESLEQAINLFEEIVDYQDVDERLHECIESLELKKGDLYYKKACKKQEQGTLDALIEALNLFDKIEYYKDSHNRKLECLTRIEALEKDEVYCEACGRQAIGTLESLEQAVCKFKQISGWKDSDQRLEICRCAIEAKIEMERKDENLMVQSDKKIRNAVQNIYEENKKRAERDSKFFYFCLTIIIGILAVACGTWFD